MLEPADVRRLAMALPEVTEGQAEDRLAFEVGGKGIAWTYLVRAVPKKPRRPQIGVLAVCCLIERKELLIEAAPEVFFDDDHYRGYPAVLVRLGKVEEAELAKLLLRGVGDPGAQGVAQCLSRRRRRRGLKQTGTLEHIGPGTVRSGAAVRST